MAKVKLTTVVSLASLFLVTPLSAGRLAYTMIPVVEDQIERPELARALDRALRETFADDRDIALFDSKQTSPHFKVEVRLGRDGRYPDHEAMLCLLRSPGGVDRYMTLLYSPKNLNERGVSWLAKLGAESIARQIKAESVVTLDPRLDADMGQNVLYLDADRRELQVELLGKSVKWQETQAELAEKSLPIAERRQNPLPDILLSFDQSPPAKLLDKANLPVEEKPYERLPIQPFKAQKYSELERQLTFPYPRFETSGPVALLLTPSLGMPDSDPRSYGTIGIGFSVTSQDYSGKGVPSSYNKLLWDGPLYRQYFSVATKLWQRLGLAIESGIGQQDARIEFEVDDTAAPGGTTFLPSGTLGSGMLDTKVIMSGLWETPTMLFRPHMILKLPTGDTQNLLGSGHVDYSLGASLEGYWYDWHVKSMISYTRPGELNVFEASQTAVKTTPFVYGSLGMGRELNVLGGERVAVSLNYMENPMRRATNIADLDKAIGSLNGLVEKNFSDDFRVRLEASYGLSSSAPANSVGLSAQYRF